MNRVDVVNTVLDRIRGETYLEIGVEYGVSFARVKAERKIAVDPHFKLLPVLKMIGSLSPQERYHFEITSDEFFKDHHDVLEPNGIDVAFIDGLHTYEQSLRDFHNCLERLSPRGIIVIHDCNPSTETMAHSPSSTQESMELSLSSWTVRWSGDVWKTIVNLRSTRPDLEVAVLNCDYGLGLVRRSRSEELLPYSEEDIVQMTYADLDANRETLLGLKEPNFLFNFLDELVSVVC